MRAVTLVLLGLFAARCGSTETNTPEALIEYHRDGSINILLEDSSNVITTEPLPFAEVNAYGYWEEIGGYAVFDSVTTGFYSIDRKTSIEILPNDSFTLTLTGRKINRETYAGVIVYDTAKRALVLWLTQPKHPSVERIYSQFIDSNKLRIRVTPATPQAKQQYLILQRSI